MSKSRPNETKLETDVGPCETFNLGRRLPRNVFAIDEDHVLCWDPYRAAYILEITKTAEGSSSTITDIDKQVKGAIPLPEKRVATLSDQAVLKIWDVANLKKLTFTQFDLKDQLELKLNKTSPDFSLTTMFALGEKSTHLMLVVGQGGILRPYILDLTNGQCEKASFKTEHISHISQHEPNRFAVTKGKYNKVEMYDFNPHKTNKTKQLCELTQTIRGNSLNINMAWVLPGRKEIILATTQNRSDDYYSIFCCYLNKKSKIQSPFFLGNCEKKDFHLKVLPNACVAFNSLNSAGYPVFKLFDPNNILQNSTLIKSKLLKRFVKNAIIFPHGLGIVTELPRASSLGSAELSKSIQMHFLSAEQLSTTPEKSETDKWATVLPQQFTSKINETISQYLGFFTSTIETKSLGPPSLIDLITVKEKQIDLQIKKIGLKKEPEEKLEILQREKEVLSAVKNNLGDIRDLRNLLEGSMNRYAHVDDDFVNYLQTLASHIETVQNVKLNL